MIASILNSSGMQIPATEARKMARLQDRIDALIRVAPEDV